VKIIISGAGIAGLSTALCLLKSGHQVTVLEQAKSFSQIGAGLQCGASAQRVLSYLGLQDSLLEIANRPDHIGFLDYKNANRLMTIPLGTDYQTRYGQPYLNIHRAELHQLLFGAVQKQSPNCIQLDQQVTKFEQDREQVIVQTSSGNYDQGELLVGADGVHSQIKSLILPSEQKRFSGNAAWRVLIPSKNLPKHLLDKQVRNFVGPKKHIVSYLINRGQYLNFVGVTPSNSPTDTSWTTESSWLTLQNDFHSWHPDVQTMIQAAEHSQVYRWNLYDQTPTSKWHSGRVVLVGDAAHAALPFMAAGATLAIEDARVLQRCIDRISQIDNALLSYTKTRYKRTRAVQKRSRAVGGIYHMRSAPLRRFVFASLSQRASKLSDFLADYDANTIALE